MAHIKTRVCRDCGTAILRTSIQCKACYDKGRHNRRECMDCGKRVSFGGIRCPPCSYARRRTSLKHLAKLCKGCGGPKPRITGRRYCDACLERRKPLWIQAQKIAADRRRQEEVALREAAGERNRLYYSKHAPEGQKWCNRGRHYQPADYFTSGWCKPCAASYAHEHRIKKEYGITADDYDRLMNNQGGRCAICGANPRTRRLAVDHDHKTKEIRGLLCKRCNRDLIGAAHEDVEMLRRAIRYLQSPPARRALAVLAITGTEG